MNPSPHRVLGVDPDATAAEIRAARRDLARIHHPDAGGDPATMQAVNAAAAQALQLLAANPNPTRPESTPGPTSGAESPGRGRDESDDWIGATRDIPSFTIEALPVEAFEALLVATAELGEVVDDDPPYVLRTRIGEPVACWCRLDVVPDAGASTVSISIASVEEHPLPSLVAVRNAWIVALNGLDWSALESNS